MKKAYKSKRLTKKQFETGQAWAATQDHPAFEYLAGLKQGAPLRAWKLEPRDCRYLGLRPHAECQVVVEHGEKVLAIEVKTICKAEADEDRGILPDGEMLAIAQPLTAADWDRIRGCEHDWVVYSTALAEVWLMLECFDCGAHGSVDDPSKEEWSAAFSAPSNPYRWDDKSRVTIRGRWPDTIRHIVPLYKEHIDEN